MNMSSPPRTTSTLAVVSLCFGIAAWTVLPMAGALVAIICGHLARREIRESVTAPLGGDGLAITGLVLGYTALIAALALIVGLIALGTALFSALSGWHG